MGMFKKCCTIEIRKNNCFEKIIKNRQNSPSVPHGGGGGEKCGTQPVFGRYLQLFPTILFP